MIMLNWRSNKTLKLFELDLKQNHFLFLGPFFPPKELFEVTKRPLYYMTTGIEVVLTGEKNK